MAAVHDYLAVPITCICSIESTHNRTCTLCERLPDSARRFVHTCPISVHRRDGGRGIVQVAASVSGRRQQQKRHAPGGRAAGAGRRRAAGERRVLGQCGPAGGHPGAARQARFIHLPASQNSSHARTHAAMWNHTRLISWHPECMITCHRSPIALGLSFALEQMVWFLHGSGGYVAQPGAGDHGRLWRWCCGSMEACYKGRLCWITWYQC